jgi:hypothetical protein
MRIEQTKDGFKTLCECFLCSNEFQFGPHIYNGHRIPRWDVLLCSMCIKTNWEGVVPATRPHLVPYLKSRQLSVKLNARGWIEFPEKSAIPFGLRPS